MWEKKEHTLLFQFSKFIFPAWVNNHFCRVITLLSHQIGHPDRRTQSIVIRKTDSPSLDGSTNDFFFSTYNVQKAIFIQQTIHRFMDTERSVMATGGRGVRGSSKGKRGQTVMEGDLTWGGEHTVQWTGDVLQDGTPETYIIFYSSM